MGTAAFGFRMHSGWGVLVAVSGDDTRPQILFRGRIVVTDLSAPGGKQPYHYAATLPSQESEQHVSNAFTQSAKLALAAIRDALDELERQKHRVVASAVLMAAGRSLPPLPKVLSSHPLIHTAEGEFFRKVVINACNELKLPVTQIRERELDQQAKSAFGRQASELSRKISGMGAELGPPWTSDHKAAMLAALLTLKKP
jgi:hypothetical protein